MLSIQFVPVKRTYINAIISIMQGKIDVF